MGVRTNDHMIRYTLLMLTSHRVHRNMIGYDRRRQKRKEKEDSTDK